MPRQVVLTTASLTLVAAVFGFWLGLRWQPLDETRVISTYVQRYISEHSGHPEECLAVPVKGLVWLKITCGSVTYLVDARGNLLTETGPET